MIGTKTQIDLIEELQLRRWARENFVAAADRDVAWSPIVHDEMERRDVELSVEEPCRGRDIVPLCEHRPVGGNPHALKRPRLLDARITVDEMHYT